MVATAVLSAVLVMIPLFGVLYWFAGQHDGWPIVLGVHIGIDVALALVLVRQLTVHVAVTDAELRGRGIFSPMLHVPLERIASVHLVETYAGQAPDSVTQLLVRDAAGRRLFRMRGSFWHPADLRAVADALPVVPVVVDEPIALSEFFRAYPGSAYWFENRPALIAVLIAALLLAAFGLALLVLTALGLPITGLG